MRYYVYMLDGQVDSKPLVMSDSPTDSPNTAWGIDQLKKNNILPCEINYDEATEEPDYENPKIYENLVEYLGKPLSDTQKQQLFNTSQQTKRQAEYPTIGQKVDALWTYATNNDQSGLNILINQIASVDKKYPYA